MKYSLPGERQCHQRHSIARSGLPDLARRREGSPSALRAPPALGAPLGSSRPRRGTKSREGSSGQTEPLAARPAISPEACGRRQWLVSRVPEGGVPGGVVAVDVGAADRWVLSCHVVRVASGGGRGVACCRIVVRSVAVPDRRTALRRGHGSCQGRGCYAGNARRSPVSRMRRHRWLLRAACATRHVRAGPKRNAPALRRNGAGHARWSCQGPEQQLLTLHVFLRSRVADNRTPWWPMLPGRRGGKRVIVVDLADGGLVHDLMDTLAGVAG